MDSVRSDGGPHLARACRRAQGKTLQSVANLLEQTKNKSHRKNTNVKQGIEHDRDATSAHRRRQPWLPSARAPPWRFSALPPLIAGEDAAAYDDLLARISAALEPSDILEEIWVRDVVDMVWDALRLRRLKAQLLTVSAYEGMHTILRRFLDWQFSEQVAPAMGAARPRRR